MRIVEDRYGNKFLEIENKEDFRKFKEDLLKRSREKMKAVKKGERGVREKLDEKVSKLLSELNLIR